MIAEGKKRRFTLSRGGDAPADLRLTHQDSLAVAQVEPPGFELTRAGRRFILGNKAAITGIANVTALPTTAAQWTIFNNDAKRTYFFETIGVYLTSGTPGVGGVLLACLFCTPSQAAATADTGTSVTSASNGGMSSAAIIKSGVTITAPGAPNWFPLASNPSPNVTAFAASTFLENRNIGGSIAVPPGQGLGLAVVAPAGTSPLFAPFAQWVEIETDME